MKLQTFVERYRDFDDEMFLLRFPHPFLVERSDQAESATRELRIYPIAKDLAAGKILIGRGASAHIPIRDGLVSTRHAELIPPRAEGADWGIADRGSTNKTFVGGKELDPNAPGPLNDGASISFGPSTHFRFFHPRSFLPAFRQLCAAAPPPEPSAEKSVNPDETITNLRVAPAKAPQRVGAEPELLLVCEPFDPVPLRTGSNVIVGRDKAHADLVLDDRMASRKHVEVERRSDGIFVRDLGSANGTYIGSQRLGEGWAKLSAGQAVNVGPYHIRVREAAPVSLRSNTVRFAPLPARPLGKLVTSERGQLGGGRLKEVLEAIESTKRSGVVVVEGRLLAGRITFLNGEPHQAQTVEGDEGVDAIKRLLEEEKGRYSLQEIGVRTITRSFSEILLDDFLSE